MASSIYRNLVITLLFFGCTTPGHFQENKKPLADSELLALVAGNVLSENVVHEIESRGLAFRLTDAYRSPLTTAGADTHILTALSHAKTSVLSGSAEKKSSLELLQHLAIAGNLMQNKQYQEAAEELRLASAPISHPSKPRVRPQKLPHWKRAFTPREPPRIYQ